MGLVTDLLRTLVVGREHGFRARLRSRLGLGDEPRAPSGPEVAPPADRAVEELPAPAGFTAVARPGELGPGELVEAIVDGVPIALSNVDGTYHAVSNVCPHAGGPLGDGILEGHTVTCPYHGWSFDVRDGSCFVNEDMGIATYEVVVTEHAVCVRLDE